MAIYRTILILAAPFVAAFFLFRLLRGTETLSGLQQRLALMSPDKPQRPHIWVHGASLGELTAARRLIEDLLKRFKNAEVIATVNTYTAQDMVKGWGNPRVTVQLAPLDFESVSRRFIRTWKPLAAITLENELWPGRILCCAGSGIPVLAVGARISQGSARNWHRFPMLAQRVMTAISFLSPMDNANGERFVGLGLAKDRLAAPVNLKSAVDLTPTDPAVLSQIREVFPHAQTFLAASTHDGEEAIILEAFADAYRKNKNLKLIMAPRHPHRGDEVARLIASRGIGFSRRSEAAMPKHEDPILLADTVGEMPIWYELAGVTIIGGSFAPKGGHTPFEPVQFGSVVVHGASTENHAEAFSALDGADAAIRVADPSELKHIFLEGRDVRDLPAMRNRATAALNELRASHTDTSAILDRLSELTGL